MSTLNDIQNTLLEMNDAAFEKLCNAFLYLKGYERVNQIGTVFGADKVRGGTPDALVALPNGKYVFGEYTTQQRGVYEKFKDDLSKCFDEGKTGIPVDRIQEIIVCCNSRLSTTEIEDLARECRTRGCAFTYYGLSELSYPLSLHYPLLARDHLGIEINTAQILSPGDFVAEYGKSAWATPLDTTFRFREEEVQGVLQALEQSRLVLISGRSGVGKSRLGLHCAERFTEAHPSYTTKCILNRGTRLYDDLRAEFSPPGDYLIIVDDANRLSEFDLVLQLLHEERADRTIKILVTVRDYATSKIREAVAPYGGATEVELQPLSEKEIKDLVRDQFGMVNTLFQDRIADISGGNPRIAVMAAMVAVREDTLDSIWDVSTLYDEYFKSIRRDIEELDDQSLLKAAGIVAFFRVIDRSNTQLMERIVTTFGISEAGLWAAISRLHELEVVDVYEEQVVKVSDQVLSTYLFYLAFFRRRALDFWGLLDAFFPGYKQQFADALYPVWSAFDSDFLEDEIRPHVTHKWEQLAEANDESALFQLMDLFWFIKETDTLLYLKNYIATLTPEAIPIESLRLQSDGNVPSGGVLSVLPSFRYAEQRSLPIALDLLVAYWMKRPSDTPKILHILTHDFGFRPRSELQDFRVEEAVVDALWRRVRVGDTVNTACGLLFLRVAQDFVQTHFSVSGMKGRRTITVTQVDLPVTAPLLDLRRKIWRNVVSLYETEPLRPAVLELIRTYAGGGYVNDAQIVAADAEVLMPFLETVVDPTDVLHMKVVHQYIVLLRRMEIAGLDAFAQRFQGRTGELYSLMVGPFSDFVGDEGREAYEERKKERIRRHFERYTEEQYGEFFDFCLQLQASFERSGYDVYQLEGSVIQVLGDLAEHAPSLFPGVLRQYLASGNKLNLNQPWPVAALLNLTGRDNTYDILTEGEYAYKTRWLGYFFELLPDEWLRASDLEIIADLYASGNAAQLPHGLDFLLKYLRLDPSALRNVVRVLTDRTQRDPTTSQALAQLFNPYLETGKTLTDLFRDDLQLLRRAYFAALRGGAHVDTDHKALNLLLTFDRGALREFLEWRFSEAERERGHEDSGQYDVLWQRDDYAEVMAEAAQILFEVERAAFTYGRPALDRFFIPREDKKPTSETLGRQDSLLAGLITARCDNTDFISYLFEVIAHLAPERRRSLIAHFLGCNRSFDAFRRLSLQPSQWGGWGSIVPSLEVRQRFLESLLPLVDSGDLLEHRQYLEQSIEGIRESIAGARKRDFMDW
jgi:hypothetical protein